MVHADKERIIQIITNLLSNVIKFTQEGIIIVKSQISSEQQSVMVEVKDPGTGISMEIYPKLFSKFATKSEKAPVLGCSFAITL